jgi:hypothetical protein
VSDPLHWAEYGIFSVNEYIKYDTVNLAYELHKAIYGFKPNYAELSAMSLEELDALIVRIKASPLVTSLYEENPADPFVW